MCFGSSDREMQPAPPLTQFPTSADAAFAQQNGFSYGSGMETFLSGGTNRVFAPGGEPRSAVGFPLEAVTHLMAGQVREGGTSVGDAMTRAALAANRVPLAGLGFDPRNLTLDVVTDPAKVNVLGAYSSDSDQMFSVHGNDANAASSPVHESIHRGLEILRNSPNAVQEPPVAEEHIVRYLMQHMAGDPESAGSIDLRQKKDAEREFTGALSGEKRRQMLDELNAAAAREIARRRPGGPR